MASKLAGGIVRTALGNKYNEFVQMSPEQLEPAVNVFAYANGFLPINPVLWPLQFSIFIVVFIFCIIFGGFHLWTFVLAYVVQALVTGYIVKKAAMTILSVAL
jgi:hypothetical protein